MKLLFVGEVQVESLRVVITGFEIDNCYVQNENMVPEMN